MTTSGVTVIANGVAIVARPGETILDAIIRSGARYPWVCRRGRCAACKVQLISGEVRYTGAAAARQVFSEEERAAGICLSCTAVPVGDVEVSLTPGHPAAGATCGKEGWPPRP